MAPAGKPSQKENGFQPSMFRWKTVSFNESATKLCWKDSLDVSLDMQNLPNTWEEVWKEPLKEFKQKIRLGVQAPILSRCLDV